MVYCALFFILGLISGCILAIKKSNMPSSGLMIIDEGDVDRTKIIFDLKCDVKTLSNKKRIRFDIVKSKGDV